MKSRCDWSQDSQQMELYHDLEWGVPIHEDHQLFEYLCLEIAQAGLNWSTVLNKREHYRVVFDGFDPNKIAKYNNYKVQLLLQDAGIIRNRLKVSAFIANARAVLEVQNKWGSLNAYLWDFVDGRPVQNSWKHSSEVPTRTLLSDKISNQLKNQGFKFIGSTVCYAFLAATGIVNDHIVSCFRYDIIKKLGKP